MGTRSGSGGILGWEKSGGGDGYDEEQREQEEECDVGLGLRMQLNENSSDTTSSSSSSVFPNRKAAPGVSFHDAAAAAHHHHHHHPYHHYLSGNYVGGSVHGNTSNLSQISYMGLGGGGGGASGNNLQVIDCIVSGTKASKSLQHNPLSIFGKMGESGNVRVPFTAAQWQELERQNMILKYMMASIPVPPELLLPISTTKSFSNVVPPSRSGGDPEPWRCRRTDGKKWRCSRDVAPHQKYCERHSHKNRPRSRKPVELPAAAKRSVASQPHYQHPPPVESRQPPSSHLVTTFDQDTPSGFPSSVASSQPLDHPRCLDWFMKGETIPIANQEWHPHQHHDTSMGLKGTATGSRRSNSGGSSRNMQSQSQYSVPPQHCSLLLMEGAVEPGHGQQTRRFFDAWSDVDVGESGSNSGINSYNPCSVKNFALPTSSLSLTMRGGEVDEYSLGSHRMGEKPHWMSSWMGSPPGGPLAEALCLGSISGVGSGGGGSGGCIRYDSSPRGCSSVTTTTTSSRSSSKDEGHEELNFIA